ncbi:MAG: peptidylprolyl isomerase [Anaerolineae bacterium]|nr:peptidylprolyl isomerase [Anaerolineae bacterium]
MVIIKRFHLLVVMSIILMTGCATSTPQIVPTTESPANTDAPAPTPIPPTPTIEPVAAEVNGQKLTLAEYERQIARYETSMTAAGQDPSTEEGQQALEQARSWVLERMLEQILIEQAATEAGVSISDQEIDMTIESLKADIGEAEFQRRLENEGMTLEEMREELRREMIASEMVNRIVDQVPTTAEHIRARHILLTTPEEAQQVLAQLEAGNDFGAMAQAYSKDESTRDNGGDLGYFPRGILTSREVEEVAFSLQPGQLSAVIQSELGYHIIQSLERVPELDVSPDNLRLLRDKAVREWIDNLWAQANVQRYVTVSAQ